MKKWFGICCCLGLSFVLFGHQDESSGEKVIATDSAAVTGWGIASGVIGALGLGVAGSVYYDWFQRNCYNNPVDEGYAELGRSGRHSRGMGCLPSGTLFRWTSGPFAAIAYPITLVMAGTSKGYVLSVDTSTEAQYSPARVEGRVLVSPSIEGVFQWTLSKNSSDGVLSFTHEPSKQFENLAVGHYELSVKVYSAKNHEMLNELSGSFDVKDGSPTPVFYFTSANHHAPAKIWMDKQIIASPTGAEIVSCRWIVDDISQNCIWGNKPEEVVLNRAGYHHVVLEVTDTRGAVGLSDEQIIHVLRDGLG